MIYNQIRESQYIKIKQMIKEGKRIGKICAELEISYSTLRRILKQYEIQLCSSKKLESDWEKDYLKGMAVNIKNE